MLLSILSGIVRGWFWDLWCGTWVLRNIYTWDFPNSTPDFIDYIRESWAYQQYYAGDPVCDRGAGSWQRWAKDAFKKWIGEQVEWAKDQAVWVVRGFVGWVDHGFDTFQDWINAIRNRVGTWVPDWASNLAGAIQTVWGRLPSIIRDGRRTFTEWANGLIDDATDWIEGAINTAKSIASNAWDWITSAGNTLKGWYDAAHSWLDDLRNNFVTRVRNALGNAWDWLVAFWNDPYGTVAGWLGSAWQKVLTFSEGAFTFWYNLWANYADDLGEFLTHPFQYLYERAEDWIIDNIW